MFCDRRGELGGLLSLLMRSGPSGPEAVFLMNFIEKFYDNLTRYAHRPLITEAQGERLVPTTGRSLNALTAAGRGTLRAHGVRPGERVVLLAPNSTRWLAADLAMLGEGTIVVPMYARQDPEELVGMMHDCSPVLVVCATEELAESIKAHWAEAPTVLFDAFFEGEPVNEPPHPRSDDDAVTIVYTSGTSGEPKGVVTTVGNTDYMLGLVCSSIIGLLGERGMGERIFHYLPFCFAGSRIVLWMCFYRGKNLITSTDLNNLVIEMKTAAPQYFLNVPRVLERIKNGVEGQLKKKPRAIRWLYATGVRAWGKANRGEELSLQEKIFLPIVQKMVFSNIKRQIGANLDVLLCGSAPLSDETQQWFEMIGVPIYQIYGLTETTAIITMDRPNEVQSGRVGYVLEGLDVRLGDENELQVKGPNIFSGYWERPEATEGAFTEDGWFKTGDQAEVNAEGNWRIIGRVKNLLVPTSGHNVPPEPIEQRIVDGIEGVEQAVLFGHGRPFITAVITGEVSREDVEAGIARVNEELPHYRRVRAFHLATELLTAENGLLTANMKLRRRVIEAHFEDAIKEMYAS